MSHHDSGSATLERRLARAVLEERRDAGARVFGGEDLGEQPLLEVEPGRRASRRGRRRWPASPGPARPPRRTRTRRPARSLGRTALRARPLRRRDRCASASSASTWRPVRIMSLARAAPTSRGSRCVPPPPGMMPSRISGWPNRARCRRDAEVAGERQLAAAAQRVAADRGDRRREGCRPPRTAIAGTGRRSRSASAGPPNSLMSAPAANTLSPPVTTTAPGGSSVSALRRDLELRSTSLDSALTFGLSSRTTATPSSRRSTSPGSRASGAAPEPHPRPARWRSLGRHVLAPLAHRRDPSQELVGRRPRVELARLDGGAHAREVGTVAQRSHLLDDPFADDGQQLVANSQRTLLLEPSARAQPRPMRVDRSHDLVGPFVTSTPPSAPPAAAIASSGNDARSSMCSRSRRASSAPGRSALLTTNTSAISSSPALAACTASPHPGIHDHDGRVGRAGDLDLDLTDADGLDRAPIGSRPRRAPGPPRASPARGRRGGHGSPSSGCTRPESSAWSCIRTRSPRIAPPVNGDVGSTASTAISSPAARRAATMRVVRVDFPAPGAPVRPTV